MALGTSRPRAGGGKEARLIEKRLAWHKARMEELMEKEGLTKEEASKRAYHEVKLKKFRV